MRSTSFASSSTNTPAKPPDILPSDTVVLSDLPPIVQAGASPRPATADYAPGPPASDRESIEVRLDQPLDETINEIIRTAVEIEGGNRSRAAVRLGVGL